MTGVDGFIPRWTLLEPIPVNGLTQSAVQGMVKKQWFPDQYTVIPKDGQTESVGDSTLTWHAVDTKLYNVNLYHFAYALKKPTSNVLVPGGHDRQQPPRDEECAAGHRLQRRVWGGG